MGAKDRMTETAGDLGRRVVDATEQVSQKARMAVEGLLPGEHGGDQEFPSPGLETHQPARASGARVTPSPTPTSGSGSSAHSSQSNLRDVHPDPGNKAGVRDTAGDRVDHQ